MVAFAIVLEILLPTVVLGCFRRRKYMEMLAIKIIRSILTLPFLFWVVQAHLTIIKMIDDTILSGYFLQDRTIVFGGAFDQPGLFKQGVLMFYALMGVVSILGLHRMWVKSAPPILTRILCCVTGCMLVLEIGPLIVYHWYLFRYIAAMGLTLYRVVGLVCGGILSVEIIAVLIYSVCRCVKPNAPACVGLFASIVAAEH